MTGRSSMDTWLGASGPHADVAPGSSPPPTWEAVARTSVAASHDPRFVGRRRHGVPRCI